MKTDPDYSEYLESWTKTYENLNYTSGAAGYFLKKSHAWCENTFSASDNFPQVLEVGAGTGIHIQFVRHKFDEYTMTDLNPPMLAQIEASKNTVNKNIIVRKEDATRLSFKNNSFDRVIAAHVLEHLYKPHEVLREWHRVLKPDGVLSLVLPCDPGLAWRLGRSFGPRRKFEQSGLAYDYWMAREHVNAINNLVAFIKYYFKDTQARWLPFRIPSMDLNLFYIVHIRAS